MTWDWDDLLEGWCEEFAPENFAEQTARTFMAALRGRAKFHKREAERDLILAYNTGGFSRASKVKPLGHYLSQIRKGGGRPSSAQAVAFFHGMKARGFAVKIERVSSASPRAAAN